MPVASALVPPRVAHPPVIVHGHAALVTAVAAITIGARVGRPTHDLAQVGNEAAQHQLGRHAIAGAQRDELVRQGQRDGFGFGFTGHKKLLQWLVNTGAASEDRHAARAGEPHPS